MDDTTGRRAPRFVYLSDAVTNRAGVAKQPAHPAQRYAWRLDAANHRPVGRAREAVRTLGDCSAAARLVHDRLGELEPLMSVDVHRGVWTWRVQLDGVVVAVSPNAYARRVECQRAFTHFQRALEAAAPQDGVVRHLGPRGLRGFEIDLAACS